MAAQSALYGGVPRLLYGAPPVQLFGAFAWELQASWKPVRIHSVVSLAGADLTVNEIPVVL